MDEISLHLEDKSAPIDARSLRDALTHLTTVLDELGGDSPHVYPVTDLRTGSAHLTMEAPAESQAVMNTGLGELISEQTAPARWTTRALQHMAKLCHVGPATLEVRLDVGSKSWRADEHLAAKVEAALNASPISLGVIEGRLCAYSSARRPITARIRIAGLEKSVRLILNDDEARNAAQLVEEDVRVCGRITRHPQTSEIMSIAVERIDQIKRKKRDTLMLPESVVGIWGSDTTDGLSSEEWVRRLRDG